MVDEIDTDFTGVDIDGAEDGPDEEMLEALADFDAEEIDEDTERDLPDTDETVNDGGETEVNEVDGEKTARDLVSLAESYSESNPAVQRVETVNIAGYDAVVAFDEVGNRLSISAVIGGDVSAAGTVIPEIASQDGQSGLVVEDGCGSGLHWVADSINIIERSVMESRITDDNETVNDDETEGSEDGDDDDSGEVEVTPIAELGDYMTPKELWSDAASFYADDNKERARELIAGALMTEMDWLCVRDSSEIGDYDLRVYVPSRGCYVEGGSLMLSERMTQVLGGTAPKSEISHVEHLLASNCMVDLEDLDADDREETLIPFKNGVLVLESVEYDEDTRTIDPSTGELLDKDPSFKFTYSLPVEWDPENADTETVETWMGQLTTTDTDAETIWEFGGHSLLPRMEPQGFLMLIASGGNGKTTLFNVFIDALGQQNTTAIPLEKIAGSKFSSWRMTNRLANMNPDISGSKIGDIGQLKNATGDDMMEVERKGIDPFDARSRAAQIWAANSPPPFDEKSPALKRRLHPVILESRFKPDPDPDNPYEYEKDPTMETKLTTDAALSAVLLKFVEGARRLQHQHEFTLAKEYSEDERLRIYESHADPIADFERHMLERDADGPGIAIDDIKACYDAYARAQDHPEKSRDVLIRMLKNRQTTVMRRSDPRSWTDSPDDRTPIYKGMAFTEAAKEDFLPEDAHWDQYGRPESEDTDEDDEQPWTNINDIDTLADDELTVDLKAAATDTGVTRYANDDGGSLADATGSIEYQMPKGTLEEGKTYAITGAQIRTDGDGHQYVELFPGVTEWTELDVDGDQVGLSDDEDDDDDDGEPVNGGDSARDTNTDSEVTDSPTHEGAQESQDAARRDAGEGSGDTQVIDRAVLQHAPAVESVGALAGRVSSVAGCNDLGEIKDRIRTLRERGDINLCDSEEGSFSDEVNTTEDDSDPGKPAGVMQSHHVQCRDCGNWWPIVSPNGRFDGHAHTECKGCGTPVDFDWNVEHRELDPSNIPAGNGGD